MRSFAAVLLALVSLSFASQGRPPSPVVVDAVVRKEVQEKRRVIGQIRAARLSIIASREPGLVAEMAVREGQRVKQGEVLARLDSTLLEAEATILEAQQTLASTVLTEREANVAQAKRDLDVLEDLATRNAVNPKELGDARTAVAVAEARLAQGNQEISVLKARRELLAQRLSDMTPRAPFDGYVVARHTDEGEWVDAGGALVEILSAKELEAWLDVPQAYFAALMQSSEPLHVEVDAGGSLDAGSWRVVPAVQASGRTFPLIVDLPPEPGLASGMSVTTEVPTGERREELTVARDGLLRGDAGFYVYVAQPGGEGAPHTAMLVPVDVLFTAGDRVAVRSDRLEPGALVAIEGNERLFPSAPVVPVPKPQVSDEEAAR